MTPYSPKLLGALATFALLLVTSLASYGSLTISVSGSLQVDGWAAAYGASMNSYGPLSQTSFPGMVSGSTNTTGDYGISTSSSSVNFQNVGTNGDFNIALYSSVSAAPVPSELDNGSPNAANDVNFNLDVLADAPFFVTFTLSNRPASYFGGGGSWAIIYTRGGLGGVLWDQTAVQPLSQTYEVSGDGSYDFRINTQNTGMSALAGQSISDSFSVGVSFSAIPEPSTYALVALGLGALWLVKRRRTSAL